MKPELKKALELIKSELSREEQIKELFSNYIGDVDLSKLDLTGLNVNLSDLKAEHIFNNHQKAEKNIYNGFQEAKGIDNRHQKLIK